MGLDLYAKVEPYLDFEEEVYTLHKEFLRFVMVNDLDNIIDIGCGQGYFLENLKVNKKKYFGIDLKDVKEKFDCATAIFDVLNYIPKNELKIFLEQTYEILNQNAYFIFDVNSYFGFDEVAQGTITIDVEDKFIAIDANFENNKLQTDITLFEKQENGLFSKEQDSIIQEYHSKEFLTKILEEIGFKQIEIKEFNLHTDEIADKLIFICKK